MKPIETKRIYENACRSKRRAPEQQEFELWHKVLRGYDARDVEAALIAWWGDTTPVTSGASSRPRGAFMPQPAELKPLVEAAQSRRVTTAREPQDLLLWQCTKCPYRSSGFMARGSEPPGRSCPSCSAPLALAERSSA